MRTKILFGSIAAIVMLAIAQYLFLPNWYRDARLDASGWLVMFSVAIGIALSILLLAYVIRWLLAGRVLDLGASARRGSKIGSYVGGFGAYPFALFVGFVVGGNLGGATGGIVSNAIGLGKGGIVVGLGLGIFIVTAVLCSLTAFIGFIIGGFVEKLFNRKPPRPIVQ